MISKDLPNEVLQQIFQLLPHPTVYHCLCVCKVWNLAAIKEFYEEITLTNDNTKIVQ